MTGVSKLASSIAIFCACSSAFAAPPTLPWMHWWTVGDDTPDPACITTSLEPISNGGSTPGSDQTSPGGGFFQRQLSDLFTAPPPLSVAVAGHANFIELDPAHGGSLPTVRETSSYFDFSHITDAVVGPLPPGRHILTWRVVTEDGLGLSDDQTIDIPRSISG